MIARAAGNASAVLPIRTERLLLRDFVAADLEDVHRYASDPLVTATLCWGPNSPAQTRAFLETAALEARGNPRVAFSLGIEDVATAEIVGGIHIHPFGDETATVELGYCLRRDCWGRGLGSEAARAMTDFGFHRLGARRLVAEAFESNRASARILGKLGFKPGEPFERHVACRDERHRARRFTLWRVNRP